MNIYIYPNPATNSYIFDIIRILKKKYPKVKDVNVIQIFKKGFSINNKIIIINWMENWVFRKGYFSIVGLFKLLIVLIYIKIFYNKLYFVRHNIYPHQYKNKNWKVNFVYKIIYILADKILIHSKNCPLTINKKTIYIPYPLPEKKYLYNSKNNTNTLLVEFDLPDNYFLIFGRIAKYKKINDVISVFKKLNKNLLIVGKCESENYYQNIINNIDMSTNIFIYPEYVNQEQLNFIIKNSSGVIVNHLEKSMIVSATIIHSLSEMTKVICLESFYSKELKERYGDIIELYNTYDELRDHIINEKKIIEDYIPFNDSHNDNNILKHFNFIDNEN